MSPQIDHLRKTSPALRVSAHIYGVSKEIDRKMFIFRVNLGMWPLKMIVLEKTSPVLRVSTHIYGVSKEIDGKTSILIASLKAHIGRSSGKSNPPRFASSSEWPFLISMVKAHTIKWQIYPDEVFYTKDLLPTRVTIYFCNADKDTT